MVDFRVITATTHFCLPPEGQVELNVKGKIQEGTFFRILFPITILTSTIAFTFMGIQSTTGLADTVLAETTVLAEKISEKTTVLEENKLILFTGF